MIDQILNRQFVLEQLGEIKADLAALSSDLQRRKPLPKEYPEVHGEDVEAALVLVGETEAREAQQSSGQSGFEPPPPGRRGEIPAPLDDFSFFSRDPVMSTIQSALEAYLEQAEPATIEEAEVPDDRRRGPSEDVAVTDRTLARVEPRRDEAGRRLFEQFSPTDIRWVSCLVAWGIRCFREKHPFNATPATPLQISDNARLVLVSDWGTGLLRAQKVAAEIRKVLDEGKAQNREQHVIHLGDVYYSGWKREYERRFLAYWPVQVSEAGSITSWSLNANHDMFSGGHAYYDFLLKEPRFARQEQSSFFSLHNQHWQVLGLDTAWDDAGLKDPQAAWVSSQATESDHKTILLSHHQLVSAYEKASATIPEKLQPVLAASRVHAWFWGHEHRCMLFHPHMNVQYGRVIGYGGTPVYMWHKETDPCPPPGEYEYCGYLQKGLERWALFGFAVLEFDGPALRVRYIDENGVEHKTEEIGAAARTVEVSAPARRRLDSFGLMTMDWDYTGEVSPRRDLARGALGEPSDEAILAEATPETVLRRTPHMDLSPDPPLSPGTRFEVRVYADRGKARPGEVSEEIVIRTPPDVARFNIDVSLVTTSHFTIWRKRPRTLAIHRDRDASDAVVFKVKVNERIEDPSNAALTAHFTYKGRTCGKVRRTVEIRLPRRRGAPHKTAEPPAPLARPTKAATLQADVSCKAPDLTVEIRDPECTGQHFHCTIYTPHLASYQGGIAGRWDLPAASSSIVDQFMEQFTAAVATPEERIASLRGAGVQLFDAAPGTFKKVFWELVDSAKPLRTIYVVSEEPYIPWELMIPHRRVNGKMVEREPLGIEFAVGRWTIGTEDDNISPPQKVPLLDSFVIAPVYSGNKQLMHSPAEASFVCARFNGSPIQPAQFTVIESQLSGKPVSLLHFVCHGKSGGVAQEVWLDGNQTLKPTQVLGMGRLRTAFESKKPMVFMNACEVGRTVPALSGLAGFPQSFIDLGASCVIAPLWSVKDNIAHEVAVKFYSDICAKPGAQFAEILKGIRDKAYKCPPHEDSYAAYCFYGDPWAASK